MASNKRQSSSELGLLESKRAKPAVSSSLVQPEKLQVVLNPADRNLDFNIHDGGLCGDALCEEGFAYCWSGARANVGITNGKYCFGCKIVSDQTVVMEDTPLDQQHLCRIGISRADDSVGNLGETDHSYGFGGTGKFSNARKFLDYGERFGVGDTIICAVEFENKESVSVGFSKNGRWLGIAKHIDVDEGATSALFPHILLKNVCVQMQFSIEDGLVPTEDYKPWAAAVEDGIATIGPSISDPSDCEVIMLVGLPASGKTTWAEKWVKEHPEKRYLLLGTNLALEQMKVPGLMRKNNYSERFELLMNRATSIFNTLLSRAASTPHSYIIDQTNVYKSARKRKLKPFAMYKKIAVVVFPKPEELKLRSKKRMEEMGKELPSEAVNEMTANFTLPTSKDMPGADEDFDKVIFPELNRDESQKYLGEMKCVLASSASNFRGRNSSSFSRETSLQSNAGSGSCYLVRPEQIYYHPPMQGTGPLSGGSLQAFSGQPQSYGYQLPQLHIPAPNPGPTQPGRLESFPSAHQTSINPYQGSYSTYDASFHPRNDPGLYAVHSYDPQPRPITNLVSGANLSQGYGVAARAEFQPPMQPTLSGPYDSTYRAPSSGPYGIHSWTRPDSTNRAPSLGPHGNYSWARASMGGSFYGPPRPSTTKESFGAF